LLGDTNNDNSSSRTRKSKAIILLIILAASATIGILFVVSNPTSYSIGSNSQQSTQDQNAPVVSSSSSATTTTANITLHPRKEFTLVAEEANLTISPGQVVKTWTYNGTVPGPTLRFTEGDNVTVHFINKTPLAHTIHMHGNHDDSSDGVTPQILPGQSYDYNFIADPAGAFMYHCHAYPTSLHIRMGMYGAIIVDPKDTTVLRPAKEFVLVLSEFDPVNQDNFVAQYYPVNGYTDQYMGEHALQVKQNELVRLYVVNAGTTIPYSFHLHSTIFKVYQSGLISNNPIDVQTIEIGPGNVALIEARWKSPGTYLFHSHGIEEERGNMGEINVLPDNSTNNSSQPAQSISMIDWQYQLQKELQNPKVIDYESLIAPTNNNTTTNTATMNASMPSSHDHGSLNNNTSTEEMANTGTTVKILRGAWDKSQNISYQPLDITAKTGSTITWINEDSVMHTVTSKQQGLFDSSMITPGQQWQHKFDEKGQYEYSCVVHPWMQGKVTIDAQR
jgi:nitrite reductase (NO-forming)